MEGFKIVALSELYESPLNKRRHFDETKMAELTLSIRENGVLQPLLVRDNARKGKQFEIVAGARRFRAATTAAIGTVPVMVRAMTDDQVLEAILIENKQREDLHPLDEAEGFKALLDRPGHDVASIAAHIGMSESHVYQRLKLLELIEPAKDAFLKDEITAGHAVLIARLQPNDQKAALNACFDMRWLGNSDRREKVLVGVRQVAAFIEQEIHLDLHAAPFAKDDPRLLSEAGSCNTCPKRTGFSPALFPDIKTKDTCTDGACFHAKREAHLERLKEAFKEKGETVIEISTEYSPDSRRAKDAPKGLVFGKNYEEAAAKGKNSCEHAQKALVTHGRDIGKLLHVCTDKNCKVHGSHGFSSPAADARQKAAERKERIASETNRRIFLAVRDKLTGKLDAAALQVIALVMFNRLAHEVKKSITTLYGWSKTDRKHGGTDFEATGGQAIGKMPALEVAKFLVLTTFLGDYKMFSTDSLKRLHAAARSHKVDVRAISRQVAARMKPKDKKKGTQAKPKIKAKIRKRAKAAA